MALHNELGKKGENFAIEFLKKDGYEIVDVNWRTAHLEIDIIARLDGILCFIEVKSRSSLKYGEPEAALTTQKQKNLLKAANQYIQEFEIDEDIRFDLITFVSKSNKSFLEHYKEVFVPFQF